MSEALTQTASLWIDTIDIHSDKIADTTRPEMALKESLKKDLQLLWGRKMEWKITDAEYVRYASTAKAIFEKQNTRLSEIEKAYTQERNKTLRESNTLLDNLSLGISNGIKRTRNLATDGIVTLQQKLISEDTIQSYNSKEWNRLVSIKEFEEQLRIQPMEEINGLAMKNYLIYLKSKGLLNRSVLETKCGWPNRLLGLSILWGTKMENDEHLRNAFGKSGFGAKMSAFVRSGATGGVEFATERIFKDVIINKVEQVGIKNEFSNEKGKSMKYEKIIEQLKREFEGKQITSATVEEYFNKTIQKWTEKLKKLQEEKKVLTKNQTVGFYLDVCQIQPDNVTNALINKNIDTLTDNESKNLFNILKSADTSHLPEDIKQFLYKEGEIQAQKEAINDLASIAGSKPATEVTAQMLNRGKSAKETLQSIAPTLAVAKLQRDLEGQNDTHKDMLGQIGFSSITELTQDATKLSEALSRLEKKWLQKSKLYETLSQYIQIEKWLKKDEAREYIKATENISERELQSQEKKWRILEWSADKLYDLDVKNKKTSNFTVPDKPASNKDNHRETTNNITMTLSTLTEDGKYVPLQEIGGDACLVRKEGDKFILSINGNTEICTSSKKVEQTLDSYGFFYDMGLKSLTPSIHSFLAIITASDSRYPRFDLQKGFTLEQQAILFRVVNKIFDLDMEPKMSTKSIKAFLPDFTSTLRTIVGQKNWFDNWLRKRWILTEYGSFHEEGFKRLLVTT